MNYIFDLAKLVIGLFISVLHSIFYWKRDDIWLIGERKREAKDNGYHLFKYIRNNHPKQKIYYIIDKGSSQKSRVEKYGQVIDHNSVKHYILFCRARKLILPFETSTFPESKLIWYFYRLKLLRKKVAFIQHGITKENQVHYSYDNRFKFDLFVCAAEVECDFVKKEMNYPENVAKNLGFARYDNLYIDSSLNQIFFMPTWRSWMSNYTEKEFLESVYYKSITSFLNDEILHDTLTKYETTIVLYLHDVFQEKFSHLFMSNKPNIIVADNVNYDVQVLLKQSKLLITDFSSVAFDFAYMGKSILYYQFDEAEYFSRHFIKGYFDYRDNGFGPVCTNANSLLGEVVSLIDNNYLSCEKYRLRSQLFFGMKDKNNCLRNYRAINEL